MFYISNLKKCLSDETLFIPLEEIKIKKNLLFVKEPVDVLDKEIKRTKQCRILIVKVRWNAKRGPKFTWETRRSDGVPILSFMNLSFEGISGRNSL